MSVNRSDTVTLANELRRKMIHLSCSILPLVYYFYLKREQIIFICVLFSILFLTAEFLRKKNKWSKSLFIKWFFPLLREDEKNQNLTGATHLFLSVTIIFLVFEKNIAVPAALVLTIADALAAVAGKLYGKHPLFRKSWEGSVAFLVFCWIILTLFFPGTGWVLLALSAVIALIEVLPLPISDNYSVPLVTGVLLMGIGV